MKLTRCMIVTYPGESKVAGFKPVAKETVHGVEIERDEAGNTVVEARAFLDTIIKVLKKGIIEAIEEA